MTVTEPSFHKAEPLILWPLSHTPVFYLHRKCNWSFCLSFFLLTHCLLALIFQSWYFWCIYYHKFESNLHMHVTSNETALPFQTELRHLLSGSHGDVEAQREWQNPEALSSPRKCSSGIYRGEEFCHFYPALQSHTFSCITVRTDTLRYSSPPHPPHHPLRQNRLKISFSRRLLLLAHGKG